MQLLDKPVDDYCHKTDRVNDGFGLQVRNDEVLTHWTYEIINRRCNGDGRTAELSEAETGSYKPRRLLETRN